MSEKIIEVRYKSKFQAVQITKELAEGVLFDGKKMPFDLSASSSSNSTTRNIYLFSVFVKTLQTKEKIIGIGDWVIKDENGGFQVFSDEKFNKTFEIVK